MTGQEAVDYLNSQAARLPKEVADVCREITDAKEFAEGWASTSRHHAYAGSLPIHTAEVMEVALGIAETKAIKEVNLTVLIPAVIFHDCMKVRDNPGGKQSDYHSKIYHIAGSYACWQNLTQGHFPPEYVDAVGHCILAHHGRRDWKAVVEPQTIEAWILHFADMMSAGYGVGRDSAEQEKLDA
jgi:3'-5' exoribonuclease